MSALKTKTPAIICFVIGGILAIIGFALIGKSSAAVSAFVILGVVLVGVGLALYPWKRKHGKKDPDPEPEPDADVDASPALAGAALKPAHVRRRHRSYSSSASSSSSQSPSPSPRKAVSWPQDDRVAMYREFDHEQPPVAVAASAQLPMAALEPRYEPPYDDTALAKATAEQAANAAAAAEMGGPVYYTPGQALPYYRTPDEIAEERQLALARPNTPELERKRRIGELAEIAATLKLERGVFSVPIQA
jgi:hypothetical protein